MSVKLELYRVFKEVAEVGNITAAAQALYISQSAVSQSIKQLENDLQTRLFSRNSRGVTLTAEGKMLYEYVRSAMGLLETGEEKLSQTRELQMGQLVIGASDTVTSQFLLPYLDGFHRDHPAIHILLILLPGADTLLRNGSVSLPVYRMAGRFSRTGWMPAVTGRHVPVYLIVQFIVHICLAASAKSILPHNRPRCAGCR